MKGCYGLKKLKVLELFAGTRSIGKAFEKLGHEVFSVEWDEQHKNIDWYADISKITAEDILERFGKPDVVWASPDCTSYSIAAISHHRRKNEETGNLDPVSDYAKFSDELNLNMHKLIKDLNPTYYFIENPRGGMRKMTFIQDLPRYTVTYCQFGDSRMKPTDIWTNHPDPKFKPMCKNGAPCHVSAPRGSRTGTQGLKGSVERSVIPEQLCNHVAKISEEEYRVCDHSGEFILNQDGYFFHEDSGESFKSKEYAIEALKERGYLDSELEKLFSFEDDEPKVFWTQD